MPNRILVVDDESIVRTTVAKLLSAHDVQLANSGAEALAAIEADSDFDLIVCDLSMPRLSGVDVFESAIQGRPELARRFVFLTGGVFNHRVQEFLSLHDCAVIEKPFDVESFHQRIDELIAQAREPHN